MSTDLLKAAIASVYASRTYREGVAARHRAGGDDMYTQYVVNFPSIQPLHSQELVICAH